MNCKKNKKEHLFDDKIHGIIESVDKIIKIIIQKRTGFMENMGNMGIYCPTVWNCFGGMES